MQMRRDRQCMTFFKVLVYQLTGEIKATIMSFYVKWLSVIDIKRNGGFQKYKTQTVSKDWDYLKLEVCQISFRSLTPTSPQANKTNTSTIILKCLHLKLSSDKHLQPVAVFCIHSTHSYPSQNTRSASLQESLFPSWWFQTENILIFRVSAVVNAWLHRSLHKKKIVFLAHFWLAQNHYSLLLCGLEVHVQRHIAIDFFKSAMNAIGI